MKKAITKILFSLMFLFCIFKVNCFATRDCRFVENQMLINDIRSHIDKMVPSKDKFFVDYGSIIFMNCNDNTAIVSVPMLSKRNPRIMAEACFKLELENCNTFQEVLDFFTSTSTTRYSSLNLYRLGMSLCKDGQRKYISESTLNTCFYPFLDKNRQVDNVFYELPSSNLFQDLNNNIQMICISHEKSSFKQYQQKFVFNKSKGGRMFIEINSGDSFFNLSTCKKSTVLKGIRYDKLD